MGTESPTTSNIIYIKLKQKSKYNFNIYHTVTAILTDLCRIWESEGSVTFWRQEQGRPKAIVIWGAHLRGGEGQYEVRRKQLPRPCTVSNPGEQARGPRYTCEGCEPLRTSNRTVTTIKSSTPSSSKEFFFSWGQITALIYVNDELLIYNPDMPAKNKGQKISN